MHRNEFFCHQALHGLQQDKKVLVLMPPPVDPGEAPINIKRINVKSPPLENSPIVYVENPAVLADTL